MANILPRLFQKVIKKVSKGGLLTALAAGSMLSSNVALGAIVNVIADATIRDAADGASIGLSNPFNNGDTLVLTGDYSITTGGNVQIGDISFNVAMTKPFTFNHDAVIKGAGLNMDAVVNAGNVTLPSITNGYGATVSGGTLAVGDISGDLTMSGGIVNQTGSIGRYLTMSGAAILNGKAGTTNVGNDVLLDNGFSGSVTINDVPNPTTVTIRGGTLTLHSAQFAGTRINFDGNAVTGTTVNVIEGGIINDVDNTTGVDSIGTLTFQGQGQSGEMGAHNSLAVVNIGAGALLVLNRRMNVDTINLTHDESALSFLSQATTIGITGDIDNIGNPNNGIVYLGTFFGFSGFQSLYMGKYR
jgi:hypothetical protein